MLYTCADQAKADLRRNVLTDILPGGYMDATDAASKAVRFAMIQDSLISKATQTAVWHWPDAKTWMWSSQRQLTVILYPACIYMYVYVCIYI